MNLETEGKINLLVTFILRFLIRTKLSLSSTKCYVFPHKTANFSNNSHDAYKNTEFHGTKLNPWKLTFWKKPIVAEDEIKVNVILTNKYKVKAKNFNNPIFYVSVPFLLHITCCNTGTISHFIFIFFLFEDFFKASKEQVTINEI